MLTRSDILALGFPDGKLADAALRAAVSLAAEGHSPKKIKRKLRRVLEKPAQYTAAASLGTLAGLLVTGYPSGEPGAALAPIQRLRSQPVPHRVYGPELLEAAALQQFDTACRLPIATRGAQMPDGHVGYGLPIGGVLATAGSVIPYAVGVDIACRMRLTIYEDPLTELEAGRDRLRSALTGETRFGIGVAFEGTERREHAVMDSAEWQSHPFLRDLKDKAWSQLGTSGSGNHFAEFGALECAVEVAELGLPAGRYLALLSHSGSRGLGNQIATFYTKIAMARCPLPEQAKHLAWLEIESEPGQAYWRAMTLAGEYAAANHELIHQHVGASAGLTVKTQVENHHNYAWLEQHDGQEVVVHRKGATPAGAGVLGVIPGSMATPGYVVRGKGDPESLCSAAHGAGRVMSRSAARKHLTAADRAIPLAAAGVELLAAGLDESPQVYKSIQSVMAAQADLVEVLAEFRPKLVLMARGGPAED